MDPDIDEVRELIDSTVDGWLTEWEGKLLYDLARKCGGRGVIVEVGSFKGRSTIWLARGSRRGRGVRVYAVDPHPGGFLQEFKRNIEAAGVGDLVTPLVKTSAAAAEGFHQPVELVFVDGYHHYFSVRLDMELWFPKLVEGGVIAFHDTINFPGPRRVVEESVLGSKYFKNIRRVDGITLAEKAGEYSTMDALRSRSTVYCMKSLMESRLLYLRLKKHIPQPFRSIASKIARTIWYSAE